MTTKITLPDVAIPEAFSPYAVFDEHLDCIRVVIRDVSTTEVRIDEHLTVLRENFLIGFGGNYVGFTLKGVNHLLHEIGLQLDHTYRLSEILDEIVRRHPASTMAVILDLIREPLGDLANYEVCVLSKEAA